MMGTVGNGVHARFRLGGACALALVALAGGRRACAQDTAAAHPAVSTPADSTQTTYRTHTVRAGETLFDLAQTYLGDGALWPEIYRLNAGVIEDPHWIYANEVLRIPAAAGAPASAPEPTTGAAPGGASEAAAPSASAPEPSVAASAAPPEGPAPTPEATLFTKGGHGATFAATHAAPTSWRSSSVAHADEHFAAPYIDRDGGPRGAGSVVGSVDLSNVIKAAEREHYDLNEDVYITLPAGVTASVGDRFYTYDLDVSFGERGQLVVPTGMVTVRQPGAGTDATIARVSTLYGELRLGQGVLPLDSVAMPTAAAQPVEDGPRTQVLWVENREVLPTLQHYVVLGASEKQGLHVGDQIVLYRPRVHLPEQQVTLPESPIATALVVRVTPYSSTATIMSQKQPDIEAGVAARVTAKAP